MSYVSGYDEAPGTIGYWGNGDGRFLYPPRDAMTSNQPCLEPPVTSIRWENLRDGMEDYEYLWLLQEAISEASKRKLSPAMIHNARQLLEVPEAISQDLTHFTTDPRNILKQRDKIAMMIEMLTGKK